MRKVILVALAIVLVTMLVLAGCSKPAPTTTKPTTPAPTTTAPKPTTTAPPTTAAPTASYPTMKLILSSPYNPPDINVEARAVKRIWDDIEKQTGGKITVQYYWGASMSGAFDTPDMLKNNTIQLTLHMPWWVETKFPLGNFEYTFPFTPNNKKAVGLAKAQISKEMPAFQQMYAKEGIRYIAAWPSVNYAFNSVKPLNSLADFKGKKFSAASRWQNAWIEKSGLVMVSGTVTDVYNNLSTGVIEGNMLPITLAIGIKSYEISKNFLEGIGPAAYATTMMNLDTYNKLGPDGQKLVENAYADALNTWYVPMLEDEITRIKGIMTAAGCVFKDMDAKWRADWYAIIPDVPALWAAEVTKAGYPGWDVVKKWQELMKAQGAPFDREWGKQ